MKGSKRYITQFMLLVAKEANQAKTYAEVARKYELDIRAIKEWVASYRQYGDLMEYIWGCYNTGRLHSTNDYKTPAEVYNESLAA